MWGCQACLRLPSPCSLDESCDRGRSAEERRWGWPWRVPQESPWVLSHFLVCLRTLSHRRVPWLSNFSETTWVFY